MEIILLRGALYHLETQATLSKFTEFQEESISSSEIQHIDQQILLGVSMVHTASIFRVED
jgi:hypothetical protein